MCYPIMRYVCYVLGCSESFFYKEIIDLYYSIGLSMIHFVLFIIFVTFHLLRFYLLENRSMYICIVRARNEREEDKRKTP